MRSSPRLAPSHGLAHATRAWLFWLALALAAAHSMAAWHAYSHSIAESAAASPDKQHVVSDPCGLCIAVAGIGGGAGAQPALKLQQFAQEAPPSAHPVAQQQAPQRRPYAIRAPPFLA